MLEEGLPDPPRTGAAASCWPRRALFDATNPAARAYVWSKARQNYYQDGIRIFWLDEAEPEYEFYHYDIYRYHLGADVQVGNVYPQAYARAFYEGMTGAGQENVINLLRCAWAGSQRYGAAGLVGRYPYHLPLAAQPVRRGAEHVAGRHPWWTTDIGGFHGGSPDDPAYREVLPRCSSTAPSARSSGCTVSATRTGRP